MQSSYDLKLLKAFLFTQEFPNKDLHCWRSTSENIKWLPSKRLLNDLASLLAWENFIKCQWSLPYTWSNLCSREVWSEISCIRCYHYQFQYRSILLHLLVRPVWWILRSVRHKSFCCELLSLELFPKRFSYFYRRKVRRPRLFDEYLP